MYDRQVFLKSMLEKLVQGIEARRSAYFAQDREVNMKQLGAELTSLILKFVLPDVKAPALNKAPALKEEPALKKDDAVGSLLVPEPTRMQLWPPTRVPLVLLRDRWSEGGTETCRFRSVWRAEPRWSEGGTETSETCRFRAPRTETDKS
jgi:hypothetical protein